MKNLQTVEQFFDLNLPMDITHLQALLSIVYHSLDGYMSGLLSHLGNEFWNSGRTQVDSKLQVHTLTWTHT